MFVEVMGQCQKCKDLLTIELEETTDRRVADVRLHDTFYRVREGRTYRLKKSTVPPRRTLIHTGIVVPCSGSISLRGGLTPLVSQADDEHSHFPQFHSA